MDKPTTNWPSDSAICVRPDGSKALVVPDTKFPRDGEWHPENAALRQAVGAPSALADFYRKQQNIEIEIRRYERRYQETGNATIAFDDAVALAERIKNLRLPPTFGGREDYIAFRAGRCLTLKEGQAAGEVYAAIARVVVNRPAEWAGCWEVTLAIPAALRRAGPVATFGVQTFQWLREHAEPVARGFFIRRDGERFVSAMFASARFGGPDFVFIIGLTPPDRDAVPVVLAPDEDTIREYIKRAASCPDHWAALVKVVGVLCQCGQPLGDALGAWNVEALRGRKRPDPRKAAKAPEKALRNHTIIEAIRALERCGIPPTRNRDKQWLARAHGWEGVIDSDYNPSSGCAIVAEGFGIPATTVEHVLRSVRE